MNSPIEEIKKAVAENRTSDALSRLLELSKSDKQLHDAILIFSGEFRDLTMQQLKGLIDNKEATQRLNVVHDKILRALGAFDSVGRVLPGIKIPVRKERQSLGGGVIFLVFLTIGLALLCFWGVKTNNGDMAGIGGILGFFSFIGLILALIVSAFKK